MKKSVLIRAALVCLLAVPAAGQVPAGPQEKMPFDGEVRVGRLDNGMTYYIRHYDNPRQRADFFIAHDVGALQEEDDQNGLAHFLEHMAFNGTKHFPGKGILNYLAANGVRFGYNVNAYTSRDRTVYNVSNVPLVREGLVDSLLLILHDWSYYIACEPGEIESERGVIREEWRRGNDARSRMARKSAEVEYDGSKYARRDVIGDMEIVNSFGRQTLIDFYHKWYRPDLQAVIVVGDVDVDAMERKIRDVMSSIPKAENPARKEVYDIPQRDKPRYGLVTDPETKAVAVKLIFYQPYPSEEERATVGAVTPKSSIERIYHGRFDYTPENYAALRYVTYILGARYLTTVREEKGGTYYVGVHDEVSARPRGYCQLVVSFDTDPKLCEMLLGEVQKGIERLAAEAPSEQEVNEAMLYFRKVNAESRSKNLKSTSYWLNKMRAEYFDGVDLDKDNEALFTAVTPAEVRRLAREILAQGNRYTAVFTQE